MTPSEIVLCIVAIVIGVAIIMFTLLRPAKSRAQIGSRPRIDLGDEETDEAKSTAAAAQEEGTADSTSEAPAQEEGAAPSKTEGNGGEAF